MSSCLALLVGNSRLHWAWFVDAQLEQAWDMPHWSPHEVASAIAGASDEDASDRSAAPPQLLGLLAAHLPLWVATVVPDQIPLWQAYPGTQVVTLGQVPLQGLYPTLGIDRALALWGAAKTLGLPALVIDAGTALTFTAVDEVGQLVGGAILPGVMLQMCALAQHTAALPLIEPPIDGGPVERWATNTPNAIQAGVMYGVLATLRDYIQDWQHRYPMGADGSMPAQIALTGGDSALLFNALTDADPGLARHLIRSPHLSLWGIQAIAAAAT